ncbi:MAG: head GIN domain-containing protein [Aurantibacter sp.]
MKKLVLPMLCLMLFGASPILAQQHEKIFDVEHFDKVIISPHIQATLIEGDEESVHIDYANVSEDEINVEVEGNTLRVYLEGAKTLDRNERKYDEAYHKSRAHYEGAQVKAIITYTNLEVLSVRGEKRIDCESKIDQKDFTLRIYGESQVYLSEVDLEKLKVTIYGESYLEVEKGTVDYQRYTAYGESKVNTMSVTNSAAKITAYGESDFRVNVSDKLKVTCYGETHITYEGSPEVDRGIVIGEATIRKIG